MSFDIGKVLIIFGVVLIAIGLLFSLKIQIPWLGKLPGDIFIERDGFRFYFPVFTSIVISILLTLLLYFFRR